MYNVASRHTLLMSSKTKCHKKTERQARVRLTPGQYNLVQQRLIIVNTNDFIEYHPEY